MKRNSAVIIILLIFVIGVKGQPKADSICWCKDYRLAWIDFQGTPMKGGDWTALTYTSIKILEEEKRGITNYQVTNYFLKNRSWVTDTIDSALLEHERLHFDMAELFARKIRASIESLKLKGIVKMQSYDNVIASRLRERRAWGQQYDTETNHGLRTSNQSEWVIKIQKELRVLETYATKCPAR